MIEILCGTIASGKSTWAKKLAGDDWIVINDDAIVTSLHGGDYTLYQEDLKPLYKSIEDHILHIVVAMGKNVVIDKGLSLNQKSRARWIALGRSMDVPVRARVFEIRAPEIHAQRRSKEARGHNYDYWLAVAQHHISVYEPPTLEEGFESIEHYKWSD
jgi:predicted kinase